MNKWAKSNPYPLRWNTFFTTNEIHSFKTRIYDVCFHIMHNQNLVIFMCHNGSNSFKFQFRLIFGYISFTFSTIPLIAFLKRIWSLISAISFALYIIFPSIEKYSKPFTLSFLPDFLMNSYLSSFEVCLFVISS